MEIILSIYKEYLIVIVMGRANDISGYLLAITRNDQGIRAARASSQALFYLVI